MKVKELIENLLEIDPDLELEVEIGDHLYRDITLVTTEVFYNNPDNKYACILVEENDEM